MTNYQAVDVELAVRALAAEERELDLPAFSFRDAWRIGSKLHEKALDEDLPLVTSVILGGQRAFHAAAPGTSPANDAWLERKFRVVEHFGQSSLAVRYDYAARGDNFAATSLLDPLRFADAGGGFPLRIQGILVGAIGVSGLEMHEDHALVVEALRDHLERSTSDQG